MQNIWLIKTIRSGGKNFGIHILSSGVADERGFSQVSKQRKEKFPSLLVAKRHFGYHADERLKPVSACAHAQACKCPFRTLRSSATPLYETLENCFKINKKHFV